MPRWQNNVTHGDWKRKGSKLQFVALPQLEDLKKSTAQRIVNMKMWVKLYFYGSYSEERKVCQWLDLFYKKRRSFSAGKLLKENLTSQLVQAEHIAVEN
jgi:hypothetical protein